MSNNANAESSSNKRVLFIGNRATYVNDIPGTLVRLAEQAGYSIHADRIIKGGAKLSFHADTSTEHGENVFNAIKKGYDVVFLQDNGNCIAREELTNASLEACDVLGKAIQDAGSKVGIYFRPPYGYEKWESSPFEQCRRFDEHFLKVSTKFDSINAYVNRAFAFAMRDTDIELWGPDNAHTGIYGAYLAVCVFFATIFNTSSKILDTNGLPTEIANTLQSIADKVSLDNETPW